MAFYREQERVGENPFKAGFVAGLREGGLGQ
jgi:hypothetical protein